MVCCLVRTPFHKQHFTPDKQLSLKTEMVLPYKLIKVNGNYRSGWIVKIIPKKNRLKNLSDIQDWWENITASKKGDTMLVLTPPSCHLTTQCVSRKIEVEIPDCPRDFRSAAFPQLAWPTWIAVYLLSICLDPFSPSPLYRPIYFLSAAQCWPCSLTQHLQHHNLLSHELFLSLSASVFQVSLWLL